jgi:probable phosphoglycerate mutase
VLGQDQIGGPKNPHIFTGVTRSIPRILKGASGNLDVMVPCAVVLEPERALEIVFARHGESTWNVTGTVQGQLDTPTLTARGRRQGRILGRRLSTTNVGVIFSSDLRRARDTAAYVSTAVGRPVTLDVRLRERCFGNLEGSPVARSPVALTGIHQERVVDADARPEGGESIRDLYARATAFLDGLDASDVGGEVVVVAHGGFVRVALAYLAGIAVEDMAWPVVDNGSLSRTVLSRTPRYRGPQEGSTKSMDVEETRLEVAG